LIGDPDIYRAAKLVIDRRGDAAAVFAAGRADLLLEEGDAHGAIVWGQILEAIEELLRERLEGEAIN